MSIGGVGPVRFSLWTAIFGGDEPEAGVTLHGCGESIGPEEIPDGGFPPYVPEPPDGGEVTDSGATFADGMTYLPDVHGVPVLPDDIWVEVPAEGEFYQCTPYPIVLDYGYITGYNLQDKNLVIDLGTDPCPVPSADPDVEVCLEGMPETGCFDGLINI
ncbi:MAG: hypothetical protein PHH60_04760, partial [Candidatus Margulisbacteria bacterium]|nr:hypothetical protein [Candidatus Margulisiibacteriota bacterium]